MYVVCWCAVCWCALAAAHANAQTTMPAERIVPKIADYMNAQAAANRFNGALLVARNGHVMMNRGYGIANFETDAPHTPQTKFRIGSITKQFTAAAILLLQEQGQLSVGDSVCKYVAECPATWQPITIHHLLTHTSGLPSFIDSTFKLLDSRAPATPTETLAPLKNQPLAFQPGERHAYSNLGYILLGHVIEQVTKKSYAEFLQQNIFNPLGMKETGNDDLRRILKGRAAGYTRDNQTIVNADFINMTVAHGAGALYSTVQDLYLWDQALYSEKLLAKSSLAQMFKPFKNNYAYGWVVEDSPKRRFIWHNGQIKGFHSMLARYPADKITIILLSNFEDAPVEDIARDINSIMYGEPLADELLRAIKVDPKIYDGYVGRYELTPDFIITVTKEGDRLIAQATNQGKLELLPESKTKFFIKAVDAQVTFVQNTSGEAVGLILNQNGRRTEARRLDLPATAAATAATNVLTAKLIKLDAKVLDTYAGEYMLTPDFTAVIRREGDKLTAQATGQPKFDLRAISETRFAVVGVTAEVSFVKEASGAINTLILHQNGQNTTGKRIR